MKIFDSIQIPGSSYGFTYDKVRKRFLINNYWTSMIYIMNLKDNNKLEFSETINLANLNISPTAIRLSSKEEIFITCSVTNTLYILNIEFKLLRKIVNIATDCLSLTINDEGSEVYVSCNNENTIKKFDALSCSLVYEVEIYRPLKIAWNNNKLFVTSIESLVVLDSKDGSEVERVIIDEESESDAVCIDDYSNISVVMNNQCDQDSKYLYSIRKTSNNNYSIKKAPLCEARQVLDLIRINSDLFILTREEEHDFYFHWIILDQES